MTGGRGTDLTPEEKVAALKEAKARGLPDGWTVTLDKRKRRKWISPSGRACDSIPKALTISVEMGLLPPDTVIKHPPPKRKRGRPPKEKKKPGRRGRPPKNRTPILDLTKSVEEEEQELRHQKVEAKKKKQQKVKRQEQQKDEEIEEEEDDERNAGEEEEEEEMEPPTDPETALEPGNTHLTTVHWNPSTSAGKKIGLRIRVSDDKTGEWYNGRIIRYDPCTHKHKIQFTDQPRPGDKIYNNNCAWIHLRMEEGIQIATQLVWAHVKGYAWWPAMVMESDFQNVREGSVSVEFFGSSESATLRNNPECLRPFQNGKVDGVIQKNKKKRNANAVALAMEEEKKIQNVRNQAAKFYAEKAFQMARHHGKQYLGRQIQIFRPDVNYPYGDTVVGRVKRYSPSQKKWLVAYELSETMRKKYDASWVNLQNKEYKVRILDKQKVAAPVTDLDLIPYLIGFKYLGEEESDPDEGTDAYLDLAMQERCCGCTEYWRNDDTKVSCNVCKGSFHFGCLDPPLTPEAYQKLQREDKAYVCSRCVQCSGCYEMDIAFGSHNQQIPPTLSFPEDDSKLQLCFMCVKAYDKGQYCPNCAHSWDDEHYQRVQSQIRWQQANRPRKRGRKRKRELEDPSSAPDWQPFTALAEISHEDPLPDGALVNPAWYHAETAQWGYTEVDMLTCDSCKLWVHAGCAGMTEEEYEITSNGDHEVYSREFLCRKCCRQRCLDLIKGIQKEDHMLLFAEPVSEKVAPNYRDVIKQPMDLQTLLVRATNEEYRNYAWVREMFELMVLNALTFNRQGTIFWKETKRFHKACLDNVFKRIGKAAPPGKYAEAIKKNFDSAKEAKKMEEDRVAEDKSTEKKDLVAGAKVATVSLPSLRERPVDIASCLPYKEVKLKATDAYFSSWMDCCYTCGSSGASDTMLFCVDCGEAFHSFCAGAPIHCMDMASASGWRCPNCKICEISGDTPQDELKMLFCEMCDRGFSLDLLDPPLSNAPDGIWVCGQCVDCHKCKNTLETNGASLKYWSRDPNICYRCGGCDGLSDQKPRKCPICSNAWRDDDTDLAQCAGCEAKVHFRCDSRALESESGRISKKYYCPSCCKKRGISKDSGTVTRDHLHDHACRVIQQGLLEAGEDMSQVELHEKLMEQIDWKTRNLWRDEYRLVVLQGVRFLEMAKKQFGDPRYLMDRFWEENVDLPPWMGQRATRFIHVAKNLKLDTQKFSARRIEHCVMVSKLAASWLKVACLVMGKPTKKVKGYERALMLLKAPHECGVTDLAVDSIRFEKNRNIISKDEWLEKFEPSLKPIIQSQVLKEEIEEVSHETKADGPDDAELLQMPTPLCGWNSLIESNLSYEWNDPRECCLCHLCGDDDAGFVNQQHDKPTDPLMPNVPHLGRLLPMGDGLWVHASCALWSSETWESESGGLINTMEKARSRGSQLKCFGCGRPGATVGCIKGNCSLNYHFPCAFACGAAFTSSKEMYCKTHKESTESVVSNPSAELMKTLIVSPEKSKGEPWDSTEDLCLRVGALVVHSLGKIEQERDGFHCEDYITPPGYMATRIFWSTVTRKTRTVYLMAVEKSPAGKPVFVITPADNPSATIKASSCKQAYNILTQRVQEANSSNFSDSNPFSRLPTKRRSTEGAFGLNGHQFFGFGLTCIRKALENCPGVEAVAAPLSKSSRQYLFCYSQPAVESIVELQRKRAAIAAEKILENTSGCARTEGVTAVARSGGSDRITRALVRNANTEIAVNEVPVGGKKQDTEKAKADRSKMQAQYREMKSVPIEQRLIAKRSHIHGWGLFTKIDLPKDSMIVEYMGEVVRQSVADTREKQYEISGEGSCYMFRLDMQRIVDATMIGCMARFMNHCCSSNAYAKVITVETDLGLEKKIMIFSLRDIKVGEEITYDYKFPVEDGSLKCTCGAPNCIGRMN